MITFIILLNCILNHGNIATYSVSDYKNCTLLLQTISCQVWLCTTTSVNSLLAVVHFTRKSFFNERALGSNLPQPKAKEINYISPSSIRASVETRPSKLHNLLQVSPPNHTWHFIGLPPSLARFCDTGISKSYCILSINWEQSLLFTRFNKMI